MKQNWKGKVKADAIKQGQEKAARAFKEEKYSQLKIWRPNKNPNMSNHRYLYKDFIWQEISLSAKAIYPVLCYMADFKEDKKFQVSQANIGRMAGINSWATIKKAINELQDTGIVTAELIQSERYFYVYQVGFVRMDEGTEEEKQLRKGIFYRFNTCIIESGIWAQLKPRQQVFYQALRSVAVIDPDEEQEWRELIHDSEETYKHFYANREHEIFIGSIPSLCRRAGMSHTNIKKDVIDELERFRLVRQLSAGYHSLVQVNLNPKLPNNSI